MLCCSVVSGGNPSEVLDPAKHAFNGVPAFVKRRGEAVFPYPVTFGRNVRCHAHGFDLAADSIAVITLVAMKDIALRQTVEQQICSGAISDIATCQQEGKRATGIIGQRVDFGRAPAPRPAYGLVPLPPFPPEAQRWAFTAELSINTWAGGPSAEAKA